MSEREIIPNGSPDQNLLKSLNLTSWGEASGARCCGVQTGPDGGSGTVAAYRELPKPYGGRVTYEVNEQEWRQATERVWIGWRKDCKPNEAGLRRATVFGSWEYPIDGQQWVVPVLRRPDGTTELPRDTLLDPYREEVKDRYRDLWERSATMFDEVVTDAIWKADYNAERGVRFAVELLGLNYHYGPAEQNALRLVDTTNWREMVMVAVDIRTMDALVAAKKKAGLLPAELPSS